MKTIMLFGGANCCVDDEDYLYLSRFKWRKQPSGYAVRTINGNRRRTVYMHKEIVKSNKTVDHANGNRLDNQKSNLRVASQQQNSWNQPKRKGEYSSRFKGVYWSKQCQRWVCQIKYNYIAIRIGLFEDERHAAMAYDLWAIDLYGDFAKTNFKIERRG